MDAVQWGASKHGTVIDMPISVNTDSYCRGKQALRESQTGRMWWWYVRRRRTSQTLGACLWAERVEYALERGTTLREYANLVPFAEQPSQMPHT